MTSDEPSTQTHPLQPDTRLMLNGDLWTMPSIMMQYKILQLDIFLCKCILAITSDIEEFPNHS